jgi:1-deoxy-D-xylulose-5-phosphate reductoisomerase
LALIADYPQHFQLVALGAGNRGGASLAASLPIIEQYQVRYVAMAVQSDPSEVSSTAEVAFGSQAVADLAALSEVDVVVNAIVGAAGLPASYTALRANKTLALANKESLVVGGQLLMPLARPDQILPIDSEHSAIFQCLLGENIASVQELWLTASGGPFRGWSQKRLQTATPAQALRHPNWRMGPKISVDSATLMNKGLEVIEAHHLFGLPYSALRVILHPESRVHSLVSFVDGSVKAQLGPTSMRQPILFALSFPKRLPESACERLDISQLSDLHFQLPDLTNYGCFQLAQAAALKGGTYPAVLNAANEVAVEAFLAHRIGFLDIEKVVEQCLEQHQPQQVVSIDQLLAVDAEARAQALAAALTLG